MSGAAHECPLRRALYRCAPRLVRPACNATAPLRKIRGDRGRQKRFRGRAAGAVAALSSRRHARSA